MRQRLTGICRIGVENLNSEELAFYKCFNLSETPKFATLEMQSEGVFGIFVNGTFVEAHKGLLTNRTFYIEITPFLQKGDNEIRFVSGLHYFQSSTESSKQGRDCHFTFVAAEIRVELSSENISLNTNTDWTLVCGDAQAKISSFGEVTNAEYDRFWKHAALWRTVPRNHFVPTEISEVVGEEYSTYLNEEKVVFAEPKKVLSSNFISNDNEFSAIEKVVSDTDQYVLYDFGKIVVGYTVIHYSANEDTSIEIEYDYTENPNDFVDETPSFERDCKTRLQLKIHLNKDEQRHIVIHRRAARFVFVKFPKTDGFTFKGLTVKTSMYPSDDRGWFYSNDTLLNKMWSVGQYTLQINRHQEYESCPRHEMKFFSGDGIMEALVDYYVSGYSDLTDATLSLVEPEGCTGIVNNKLCRNIILWDYPAWRIIMLYNYFLYFWKPDALKCYFDEAASNLEWMLERIGSDNLVYQHLVYGDPFFSTPTVVEYTGSEHRLGRKTYLNVLFYKSFLCMAEMARAIGDSRADEWTQVAVSIKTAINQVLWCEEKNAYIDEQQPHYIPQEGNALAVLFGVAEGDRIEKVFQALQKNNWTQYGSTILSTRTPHTRLGNAMISPVMCTYEAEARFLNDDSADAVELMKRCWGSMVQKGAESYWEFAPNDASRWVIPAHGWASGCTYLFGAYIMGVRPLEKGYEKVLFAPRGDIGDFKGVVPTSKGDIAVQCKVAADQKVYTLVIPNGMDVVVDLPGDGSVNIVKY